MKSSRDSSLCHLAKQFLGNIHYPTFLYKNSKKNSNKHYFDFGNITRIKTHYINDKHRNSKCKDGCENNTSDS